MAPALSRCVLSRGLWAILVVGALVAGCSGGAGGMATRVDVSSHDLDASSFDLTDFGLVLNRVIDGDRIRGRALIDARPLLDSFLAEVAVVGPSSTPELFPTRESRLAYVLNCHSAALLRSLVALATDTTVPELVPAGFTHRFAFKIDGAWRTPAALRGWAKSLAGDDWRVTLALATVRGDGPAIAGRPYLPALLGALLDKQVRDSLASPRVVRLDFGEVKQILLWEDLFGIRGRLIAEYERKRRTTDATMLNVLLVYADSGFRRVSLNSAVGYAVHRMPEDRTIPWE